MKYLFHVSDVVIEFHTLTADRTLYAWRHEVFWDSIAGKSVLAVINTNSQYLISNYNIII